MEWHIVAGLRLWSNPAEKHALTICRASSSSVASAGEIQSPSGRHLAMNAIIQFLFCYQPRTEQRLWHDAIWRTTLRGWRYSCVEGISPDSFSFVPVSVVWAVYFITSIYRMDFFILLTSFTIVNLGVYFQGQTLSPGAFHLEDGHHPFKWLLLFGTSDRLLLARSPV